MTNEELVQKLREISPKGYGVDRLKAILRLDDAEVAAAARAYDEAIRKDVKSRPVIMAAVDGGNYSHATEIAEPAKDTINPSHYKSHPSGVECITVTEHFNFCLGNAIKYVWRAGQKGSTIEDLKKARWYLDREIARLEVSVIVKAGLDSVPKPGTVQYYDPKTGKHLP